MSDIPVLFYVSIFSAAVALSAMGLWFTAVIPGIDRWSKRFFLSYFAIFMLCCLCGLVEMTFNLYSIHGTPLITLVFVECLVLAIPMPMLTVYLLHCCGEDRRSSRFLRAVAILFTAYLAMLISAPFAAYFGIMDSYGRVAHGPWYTLFLLPLILILLLNLTGTIRRRRRLSLKVFLAFLVATLPITLALVAQVFVDVFPLLDISYVLSTLSMYSLVLSDQIEQDRRRQAEIARQQREIAHQRASVMVLRMRPHFIYNTLMSIYSLCNIDPQRARQVTKDFTEYLRRNFNAVASDSPVPFSAELEHARAYLAVEQAQFEDMLLVDFDTPYTRFRLPALTLQPLVENAVKHGMDPYAGPLHVLVRTRRTGSAVEIVVEDSGPGFDPSGDDKPHATLDNIGQRLEMMCAGTMTIGPRDGGGTVVRIVIPLTPPLSD